VHFPKEGGSIDCVCVAENGDHASQTMRGFEYFSSSAGQRRLYLSLFPCSRVGGRQHPCKARTMSPLQHFFGGAAAESESCHCAWRVARSTDWIVLVPLGRLIVQQEGGAAARRQPPDGRRAATLTFEAAALPSRRAHHRPGACVWMDAPALHGHLTFCADMHGHDIVTRMNSLRWLGDWEAAGFAAGASFLVSPGSVVTLYACRVVLWHD
jgi:hypothetical protein